MSCRPSRSLDLVPFKSGCGPRQRNLVRHSNVSENCNCHLPPRSGLLGVARANTAVGVSPETFLLLLQRQASLCCCHQQRLHDLASDVRSYCRVPCRRPCNGTRKNFRCGTPLPANDLSLKQKGCTALLLRATAAYKLR
jgi:hypothetical protein